MAPSGLLLPEGLRVDGPALRHRLMVRQPGEGGSRAEKFLVPETWSQGGSPMARLLEARVRPRNGSGEVWRGSWASEATSAGMCPGPRGGSLEARNRACGCLFTGAKAFDPCPPLPPSPTPASPPGCCKYFILLERLKQVVLRSLQKLASHRSVQRGACHLGGGGTQEGGGGCSDKARPIGAHGWGRGSPCLGEGEPYKAFCAWGGSFWPALCGYSWGGADREIGLRPKTSSRGAQSGLTRKSSGQP